MTDSEYMEFILCRQTRFFSKGINPVLQWLKIKRDGTDLKFRKVLEAFGYVMRYILQRIILQAVKLENNGKLVPMKKPISLESYQEASQIVNDDI